MNGIFTRDLNKDVMLKLFTLSNTPCV